MSRFNFDKATDRYYVSAEIDGESRQFFFETEEAANIDADDLRNVTNYRVANVIVVKIDDEDLEEYATDYKVVSKPLPTYKVTKVYEISDVNILEVTVEDTNEVVGYIRRTPVERPSRGGFYPSTTTHIDWLARYKSGKYMTFLTRKAALAYITECHYYANN